MRMSSPRCIAQNDRCWCNLLIFCVQLVCSYSYDCRDIGANLTLNTLPGQIHHWNKIKYYIFSVIVILIRHSHGISLVNSELQRHTVYLSRLHVAIQMLFTFIEFFILVILYYIFVIFIESWYIFLHLSSIVYLII